MATTTFALLLALLLLPFLVLLWATESRPQRAKRLRSYGWSQQRIADHLGVTRHRIRVALAT
jgi:hypothetical protein